MREAPSRGESAKLSFRKQSAGLLAPTLIEQLLTPGVGTISFDQLKAE